MKMKNILFALALILIIILLVCLLFRSCHSDNTPKLPTDENAVKWEGNQQLQQAYNGTGGIAIPGFNSLVFTANQEKQKVNFYNPQINSCLFRMTLFVDEVEYWQSGYVVPGNGYYEIELQKPLLAGEYKAYLKIECFKSEGQPLNGTKIEFDLLVQ